MSIKYPQDHLPAKNEKFTINTAAGTVKVNRLAITAGFVRRHRHLSEIDIAFAVVEKFADEKALKIIDKLEMQDFQNFFKEWQERSGANLGE